MLDLQERIFLLQIDRVSVKFAFSIHAIALWEIRPVART
jgi:hypothetical protein